MSRKKGYKHPDYIAIYRHTFKSPAWQALSVGARAVYLELASNYNTKRMNAVYLAARTGAERLGASRNTIVKWLRELQHYGFIALVRGGSLGAEGYGLAQTFRLTDRPYGNSRATYDFQNWTGEVFNPEPTGGRNWRTKKPAGKKYPVPREEHPRPMGSDIEKTGPESSLCPTGSDIETAPDRPSGSDITSLTSCLTEQRPMTALREWSPPALAETPYTPELRKLYKHVTEIYTPGPVPQRYWCEEIKDERPAKRDDAGDILKKYATRVIVTATPSVH